VTEVDDVSASTMPTDIKTDSTKIAAGTVLKREIESVMVLGYVRTLLYAICTLSTHGYPHIFQH
jgi:hypothetical protein